MYLTNLDGQTFKLSFAKNKNKNRRSKLCEEAIILLREIFPTQNFLEEVSVKVDKKTTLYLDLYCPMLQLCVEVHGKQHEEFSGFFHKTKADWFNQLKNDRKKREFLQLNNIKLIELYDSNKKNWRRIIQDE